MGHQLSPVGHEERLARAALSRVLKPGEREVGRLLRTLGAVPLWAAVCTRDAGIGADLLRATRARVAAARPEEDLAAVARLGGRFVCPGDAEWPAGLDVLGDAQPVGLWVRGPVAVASACARSVAVVGARAATAYGMHVAGELGAALADREWTVVSGGAYGIDGGAHRGALAAGGVTVAVLACGVDVPYPRGHESLLQRIAAAGSVVSEWPPGCAPMRHRFLTRNRVIAAVTAGTVVVEAAARSGALNTARHALSIERPLMAVPGPVTSAMSAGANGLLRIEGVRCVTLAAEIFEEVGPIGALAPPVRAEPLPRDSLDEISRRVLDAVPVRRGRGPAQIAGVAGVEIATALRSLGALELDGFVERVEAGYRLTGAARPPRRPRPGGEVSPPTARAGFGGGEHPARPA